MKNILKTTIFTLFTILLVSCTNDKEPITSLNGFEYRDVSEIPSPAVLLKANASQVYKKLEWDRADFGVPVAATYSIVITDHDKDPNFLKPTEAVESVTGLDPNPDARKATLTVKMFNDMISQLETFNCGVMNIDVRIKSIIGTSTNKQIQYTEPETISVTGYSTDPNFLSFSNVSSTTLTANIASSTADNLNDYQGYMYLEPGDYKFYQPDACGNFIGAIAYGSDPGGVLVLGGGSNISITTAGYYFVTADLTPGGLKYAVQFYKAFGVFGLAVRNNPGSLNMIPMTAEGNSNIWSITIDLFKGRVVKFKSNDWTAPLDNLGGVRSTDANTKLISTLGGVGTTTTNSEIPLADFGTGLPGSDIKVPGTSDGTKQKYKITIDVSKPRAYTYKLELVE